LRKVNHTRKKAATPSGGGDADDGKGGSQCEPFIAAHAPGTSSPREKGRLRGDQVNLSHQKD
jgi:hypothetical protein